MINMIVRYEDVQIFGERPAFACIFPIPSQMPFSAGGHMHILVYIGAAIWSVSVVAGIIWALWTTARNDTRSNLITIFCVMVPMGGLAAYVPWHLALSYGSPILETLHADEWECTEAKEKRITRRLHSSKRMVCYNYKRIRRN